MSLFGAVRLYAVSANRIERDLASSDGGSMPPHRDGACALWARTGIAHGWSDPA